jgi:hypothetical protein
MKEELVCIVGSTCYCMGEPKHEWNQFYQTTMKAYQRSGVINTTQIQVHA